VMMWRSSVFEASRSLKQPYLKRNSRATPSLEGLRALVFHFRILCKMLGITFAMIVSRPGLCLEGQPATRPGSPEWSAGSLPRHVVDVSADVDICINRATCSCPDTLSRTVLQSTLCVGRRYLSPLPCPEERAERGHESTDQTCAALPARLSEGPYGV
jgi:hypothetical protein